MIKVDKGHIQFEGDSHTLLSELAFATSELLNLVVPDGDVDQKAVLCSFIMQAVAKQLEDE